MKWQMRQVDIQYKLLKGTSALTRSQVFIQIKLSSSTSLRDCLLNSTAIREKQITGWLLHALRWSVLLGRKSNKLNDNFYLHWKKPD